MSILARAMRTWETLPFLTLGLPHPGRRLAVAAVLATALAALFTYAAVLLWTDVLRTYEDRASFEPREGRGDFIAFYVAGEFALEGRGDEIYNLETLAARENELMPPTEAESRELPFYNPPFVAGIFALVSLLAYEQALWAWLVINVAVLAGCVAVLDRILAHESYVVRLLFALGAVSSIPVYRALGLGQASLFVLLFSTLAFTWLAERRDRGAGVAVGLLLIKPQYAILPALDMLVARRWLALRWVLGFAVAAFVGSVLVAGPEVLVDYPRLLLESGSWQGEKGIYPANWFSWTGFFSSLSLSATPASLLGIALGLIGAGAALVTTAGSRQRPGAVLAGGAALATAILLFSPHVYRQDLVLMLFPAAVLISLTSGRQRLAAYAFLTLLWCAAWVPVIVPAMPEPPWHEWRAEDLGLNVFVPFMALLLVVMILLTRRESESHGEPYLPSANSNPALLRRPRSAYDGLDATKCSER